MKQSAIIVGSLFLIVLLVFVFVHTKSGHSQDYNSDGSWVEVISPTNSLATNGAPPHQRLAAIVHRDTNVQDAQQSFVTINGERFHVIGAINGILLTLTNNALEIQYVSSNSLAAEAGLRPGLIIQQIDGANTFCKSLRECRLMTFGPIGSEIHFVVVDPAKNETNRVAVLRQKAAMRDAD